MAKLPKREALSWQSQVIEWYHTDELVFKAPANRPDIKYLSTAPIDVRLMRDEAGEFAFKVSMLDQRFAGFDALYIPGARVDTLSDIHTTQAEDDLRNWFCDADEHLRRCKPA